MSIKNIKLELKKSSDPKNAEKCLRFFKTGKGEYGEGDKFIGVIVPEQRKIAKKYIDTPLKDLQELLNSEIHEYRQISLMILVYKFQNKKTTEEEKEKIYKLYLKNTKNINNWDLVDISAHHIVGKYLLDKDREILYKLAKSKNLWEKRIAIISTFAFIRTNEFEDTLKISEMLLNDNHDLMHKAVGWMLREVGNRNLKTEEDFLRKYYKKMPRTMLRYAIEKFEETKRQKYLKGDI